MLTYNFRRLFTARGIVKPFTYLVSVGYSENFATRVVNSRIDKMNLKDVEKLCELLICTPNDLLEWTPTGQNAIIDPHPLVSLRRTGSISQLNQLLNAVPLNKLGAIEALIKQELKKE